MMGIHPIVAASKTAAFSQTATGAAIGRSKASFCPSASSRNENGVRLPDDVDFWYGYRNRPVYGNWVRSVDWVGHVVRHRNLVRNWVLHWNGLVEFNRIWLVYVHGVVFGHVDWIWFVHVDGVRLGHRYFHFLFHRYGDRLGVRHWDLSGQSDLATTAAETTASETAAMASCETTVGASVSTAMGASVAAVA